MSRDKSNRHQPLDIELVYVLDFFYYRFLENYLHLVAVNSSIVATSKACCVVESWD
jgi:hypothetical protein